MSKSQDRLNALAEEVASRPHRAARKRHCTLAKALNGVTSRPHNPITASQYSGANWLLSANGCRNARVFLILAG